MKSYNDTRLLFGLALMGIAAGLSGRFFETQQFSFGKQNDLNQASAILAVQNNLLGAPKAATDATLTLAISNSEAEAADVSFSRANDCNDELVIKSKDSYTVGFLCVSAKDVDMHAKISEAAPKVNALVVSINFGTSMKAEERETLAYGAIDTGAAMVVGFGPKASKEVAYRGDAPIVYSLGEPATKATPRPKTISLTAGILQGKIANVSIK